MFGLVDAIHKAVCKRTESAIKRADAASNRTL